MTGKTIVRIPISLCVTKLFAIITFFMIFCSIHPVLGIDHINTGFQTIGLWDAGTFTRMDVAIWYPTLRSPKVLKYDGWNISSAINAPIIKGKHPLIILSHDTSGSRFSHHDLAETLAKNGFIVAAMTHWNDNIDNLSKIFTLDQLEDRVHDISFLITTMLTNSQFASSIDKDHIAVIGFGPGGAAALLASGGRLDALHWNDYCTHAGKIDPYCSPYIKPRLSLMAQNVNKSRLYIDRRIKATVIIAPSYGMFFSSKSLKDLNIPFLILKAGLDPINRAPHHADAINSRMPISAKHFFDILPLADHPALMSQCPQSISRDLKDLCIPMDQADREATQKSMARKIIKFLKTYLIQ